MDTHWDCIVIGGGAAGLSAALVLGRARRRVLLLDAGGQSNLAADHIGGLLGHDGRPAPELYARGHEELAVYPGVEVRAALATSVRREGDGPEPAFAVDVAGAAERTARVVLAMGADYQPPAVPGLAERFGGSVFHCPFCHGWEHREGALGVLDPSPHGSMRALLLTAWSDDVTLFTAGAGELDAPTRAKLAAAGVAIEERVVVAAEGDMAGVPGPGDSPAAAPGGSSAVAPGGSPRAEPGGGAADTTAEGESGPLARLRFADGDARACTGLLVPVGLVQRGPFADDLGLARQTEGPWAGQTIAVSPMGATSVPGVFAAGDCATANPSVANAIASGALAAAGVMHAFTIG